MRVLVLFFKYSVAIVLGLVVLAAIVREGLLFWGSQQVRAAENKMELIAGARFKSEYDQQCKDKGVGRPGMKVRAVELRFTSDTQYQIDVVCEFFANDPIVVQEYTLPMFVKKAKGQAGFVWDPEQISGVTLEVYGRQTSLVLEGGKFSAHQGAFDFTGIQPSSTCGGFGFACCPAETQIGDGDNFSQVSDCPNECFSTCLARPVVLRFMSDPNPDLKTRSVTVAKGAPITFYFITDPGYTKQATTRIEFGDSEFQEFNTAEANYTHQYQCALAECRYQAQLIVTDHAGNTNAKTTVSTIDVVVR